MKHKSAWVVVLVLSALLAQCNAYNLVEKLEKPGGDGVRRKVFVSSLTTTPTINFGLANCTGLFGILNADCTCKSLAASAGLANSQNFVAWLSDSMQGMSNDARCRIQGFSGTGCSNSGGGPWYNTQGQLVAKDITALTSGTLNAPIQYTENGTATGATQVFTGTNSMGNWSGSDCMNWNPTTGGSGTVGDPRSASLWTDTVTPVSCMTGTPVLPVYCFESP